MINSKHKWYHGECRCEYEEVDDWGSFENDYMWNSSTCNCEFTKHVKLMKI